MQRFTIQSRTMHRPLAFSRPGRSYIYVDLNEKPGTLGQQICEGGRLSGSTLSYSGEDQAAFEQICRRWYTAYRRGLKE